MSKHNVGNGWYLNEDHRDSELVSRAMDGFVDMQLEWLSANFVAGYNIGVLTRIIVEQFRTFIFSSAALVAAGSTDVRNFDFLAEVLTQYVRGELMLDGSVDKFGLYAENEL